MQAGNHSLSSLPSPALTSGQGFGVGCLIKHCKYGGRGASLAVEPVTAMKGVQSLGGFPFLITRVLGSDENKT